MGIFRFILVQLFIVVLTTNLAFSQTIQYAAWKNMFNDQPNHQFLNMDDLTFEFGFGMGIVNYTNKLDINDFRPYSPRGISIGGYYVLWQRNDFISLGASFAAIPGIDIERQTARTKFVIQIPAMGMLKIGAGSTKFNENMIGGGFCIGLIYTKHLYENNIIVPAIGGELTVSAGGFPFVVRYVQGISSTNQTIGLDTFNTVTGCLSIIYPLN